MICVILWYCIHYKRIIHPSRTTMHYALLSNVLCQCQMAKHRKHDLCASKNRVKYVFLLFYWLSDDSHEGNLDIFFAAIRRAVRGCAPKTPLIRGLPPPYIPPVSLGLCPYNPGIGGCRPLYIPASRVWRVDACGVATTWKCRPMYKYTRLEKCRRRWSEMHLQ
jgi:hypothetical protein